MTRLISFPAAIVALCGVFAPILVMGQTSGGRPPVLNPVNVRGVLVPRNASDANIIARCNQSTKDFYLKEWNRTFDTTTSPRYTIKDAKNARKEFGLRCAGGYSAISAPDSLLVDLAGLYAYIDEDSLARYAVRRSLSMAAQPPKVYAERLVTAVRTYAKDTTGVLDARKYMLDLEQLGPEYLPFRLRAMNAMFGLFQKAQWFDRSSAYGDTLFGLTELVNHPALRDSSRPLMAKAIMTLALTQADAGRGGFAVWLAERIIEDYGDTPTASTARSMLPRFRLLGRPAPAITGEYWLNPSRNSPHSFTPEVERVTVLLFTRMGCDGCDSIAKAFRRLHEEFSNDGKVHFSLVTRTNMLFDRNKRALPMKKQITEIDKGLVRKYDLRMPVAIEVVDTSLAHSRGVTDDEHRYKVDGYPMFALIDTEARVRYLITGWGEDSERRLRLRIAELLRREHEFADGER